VTGEHAARQRLLRVGLLALLALLPLAFEQYKLYVASLTLVYLVMAIGLNLTLGYAGQISLAHGAFMAFGAYAVAILGPRGVPFELGLALGAALAFALGLPSAFPPSRSSTTSSRW
jgi:branched-chain amino acid transport system permease protein